VKTDIIIRATRPREVLGEKGRRIRELTTVSTSFLSACPSFVDDGLQLVQKRFGFAEKSVELYAERVANKGLCASAQAESLRYKLLYGLAVRRACYGVLRVIMEAGAKGAEVSVSGKVRAQRAQVMKFADGYMISTGHPKDMYIVSSQRNVMMRQGIIGVRVKIMLPHDPSGKLGPKQPIPDTIVIKEPKEDESAVAPVGSIKTYGQSMEKAPAAPQE